MVDKEDYFNMALHNNKVSSNGLKYAACPDTQIPSRSLDLLSRGKKCPFDTNVIQQKDCSNQTEVSPLISKTLDPEESSPVEQDATNDGKLKFRNLTRHQKCIFVLCIITYFMEGCGFSIIAPFFPQEAAKKGMSLFLTGLAFSIFQFMVVITAPFIGANMRHIGLRFSIISGVFVSGVCIILFGFLDRSPPGSSFIALSFLCRSIEAIGYTAYYNGLMSLLSSEFPRDITSCFAIMESANGIGMMVGPGIGGLLYQLGGYELPFFVTGGVILLNGMFVVIIIPDVKLPQDTKEHKISKIGVLKNWTVILVLIAICIGSFARNSLSPVLAPHLETFKLSAVYLGLIFFISPFTYLLFVPVVARIAEWFKFHKGLIVIGHLMLGVSFFFIGPSPFLPFLHYNLEIISIGLGLSGMFFGCSLMPVLKVMMLTVIDKGYDENGEMYTLLTGMLSSAYALGAFLGPMAAGVIAEQVGFSMLFTLIGIINLFIGVILKIHFAIAFK